MSVKEETLTERVLKDGDGTSVKRYPKDDGPRDSGSGSEDDDGGGRSPYFPETYAIRKHSDSDSESNGAAGKVDKNGEAPKLDPNSGIIPAADSVPEKPKSRSPPAYRKMRSRRKILQIQAALASDPVDLESLRHLAVSEGGLVNDALRRKVWPQLLQLDPYEVSPKPSLTEIENHKEYSQVLMDVQRCLKRFPPGIPPERRLALQDQLTSLIIRVLLKHPKLAYYQGYHDICVTFLLVVGEELAFALMEKLSVTSLRKFMEPTMESTVEILNYISPIVGRASPKLQKHLEDSQVSPIFCLSWLITWFGHVLGDYRRIVRLYDFFLATPPPMPVYLAAAIVLHRQQGALELEPDMAALHHFLSNVPDDLPFEQLVTQALRLHDEYPPEKVRKDARRALATGSGFYHRWICSDSKLSFGQRLAKRLKHSLDWILPEVEIGGLQRWLAVAGVIALPVVVAVLVYSYTSGKSLKYPTPFS